MTDVVQFPGSASDRALNDDSDRRFAEAFRNLEGRISDCVTMAGIGVQMICNAAGHAHDMLTKLKVDYYAAWHNERAIEP